MRATLTLTVILLFNLIAHAKTGQVQKGNKKVIITEIPVIEVPVVAVGIFQTNVPEKVYPQPGVKKTRLAEANTDRLTILYKMRENIIRRELMFIPSKKWRKWV